MKKCGRCGTSLPRDAAFCYNCGGRIRRRLLPLKLLVTVFAVTALALQSYATIASTKSAGVALLEAGIPYYVEDGVAYVVVAPDPGVIEGVAGLVGGLDRFGLSACHPPLEGFKPPFSLEAQTKSGTRLASVVDEAWVAGMGSTTGVSVTYNGTHAVVTLRMRRLDYMAVATALAKSREDACVRVLIG